MPRQGRIDFPGALHHIMVRGIEPRNIFNTKNDKKDFLKRLSTTQIHTQTPCYSYALMSNHFHILLQTGPIPLSRVMQSLLTGYAVSYNLRHSRAGKLYQNRFKSVLCDKEEYLLKLIQYIHLNPMRVGLIATMGELDTSPLTGHSIIMGMRKPLDIPTPKDREQKEEPTDWLDAKEVLSHFSRSRKKAREEYRAYIEQGLEEEAIDLDGGGLARSLPGEWEIQRISRDPLDPTEPADERILGGGEFVEAALTYAQEQESKTSRLLRNGMDFEKVLKKAAETVGVSPEELMYCSRGNSRSQGRALLCKWMIKDLGYKQKDLASQLGVTRSSVSHLVRRGARVEQERGVQL